MTVTLKGAFTPNPLTAPVLGGVSMPANIDWKPEAVGPADLFLRQLKHNEFDVAELSMSSFSIAISQGDRRWLELPIFTARGFYHSEIIVRSDSGIQTPAELRGRRVGVLEYQQTSVVWIRGILEYEFGLAANELEWFMERRPEDSHGGATGFATPSGVRLSYVAPDSSLAAMLQDGSIDAILFHPPHVEGIDERHDGGRASLKYRSLFPDPRYEGDRYFRKMGIIPINHGFVVRRSIVEQNPGVAQDIYETFLSAHNGTIVPYGIKANRLTLETLLGYLHEQGLTEDLVDLRDIFVGDALEW
jgi:4,5-dihydroxyphthalate decarboxylase